MITHAQQCFWPSGSSLVLLLAVFASATSSQAEVNVQTRPNDGPCKYRFWEVHSSKAYFFYQQSTHPRDCSEVVGICSTNSSGVYAIKPDGYPEDFDARCDSDGYTLMLRRAQGQVSFNRTWEDYAVGFGFLSHGFWLCNRRLSYLTNQKSYQLRIDVTLSDSSSFYVTYDKFRISEAHSSYRVISTGQHLATIVTCPDNMVPGTCACQRSCADPDDCTTSSCHVTGSCVCPGGILMSDGYCIPEKQCGCYMAEMESGQGAVLQEGGEYVSQNCGRRCSCTSCQLACEEDFQCSPQASCELGTNGWNCSCNEGFEGDGVQCSPSIIESDCQDIYDNGQRESGQYSINPTWSRTPIQVYCNMADGGGWTVIQRQDGSDNFYRNWADYKTGFGSPGRGMWLGNEKIHELTNQGDYQLRVDLTDNSGTNFYASYSLFRVGDEASKYTLLSVGTYSGNTGYNALSWHVNKKFSTRDQDNDDWDDFDCAEQHGGGWWLGYDYHGPSSNSHCRSYCPSHENYCDYFSVGSGCGHCAKTHLNADYHSTTRGGTYSGLILWDTNAACSTQK